MQHLVLGTSLTPPFPGGHESAYFAMGCFWGAERIFWQLDGVHTTAAGYQGGHTPQPTYRDVCSGRTGHAESVLVVFDPAVIGYDDLLRQFWENHDPTQGMRQGNDRGSQYRSAIFTSSDEQLRAALASRELYAAALAAAGRDPITTEIAAAGPFHCAEPEHQQYLARNPGGYCNHGFNGVSCLIPAGGTALP